MSTNTILKQYSQAHSYAINCLRAGVGAHDNRVPIEVVLVAAPDNLDDDAREDMGNRSWSFAPASIRGHKWWGWSFPFVIFCVFC